MAQRFARGLFFGEEHMPTLRRRAESEKYAAIWEGVCHTAQSVTKNRGLVTDGDTMNDWYYVRNRLMDLSMSVLLTGEKEQAGALNRILMDLCTRGTDFWQGPHYPNRPRTIEYHGKTLLAGELETAQLAMGISAAYDWGYAHLTDAVKEQVLETLRYIAMPLLRNSVRFQSEYWVMNHLCVISTGMAMTAMLLGDREPTYEEDIALAKNGLNLWMEKIEEDGSYGESYHYWSYPVNCLFLGLYTLRNVLGAELQNTHRMARSLRWAVNNQVGKYRVEGYDRPVAVAVNNYDCPVLFQMEAPEALLFTRFFGDPLGQWYIDRFLMDDPPRPDCVHHAWHRCNSILFALNDDSLTPRSPVDLELAKMAYFADTGFVYMRSSWERCGELGGDTVLALQSGGGGRSCSHEHFDKNSFSLYAHGEYLICDPGHSCYRGESHHKYDTATASHNTLSLNGENQSLSFVERGMLFDEAQRRRSFNNQAYTVGRNPSEDVAYVASEARKCYEPYLNRFTRRIWFIRPDCFVIWDSIDASNTGRKAVSGFNINNRDGRTQISINGNVIDVARPFADLRVEYLFPGKLRFDQSPARLHHAYHIFTDQAVEGKPGTAVRLNPETGDPLQNRVDYLYVLSPREKGAEPASVKVLEMETTDGLTLNSIRFEVSYGDRVLTFVINGEAVSLLNGQEEMYRY